MATLRELKGRIGSVASSEKITGAMKMISSAKMHKAEGALQRLVPFQKQVQTVLAGLLGSDAVFDSPLVTPRAEIKNALVLVWGSDDGLCGAYNANLFKQLKAYLGQLSRAVGQNAVISVMPVGKKMAKAAAVLAKEGIEVKDAPQGINSKSDGQSVRSFTHALRAEFENGRYDRIDVVYMNFISAGRQRPVTKQLLPVLRGTLEQAGAKGTVNRPYIFEPDAAAIFNAAVPMFLMATVQDIFSQNQASEQAARVMAMQSANDNAKNLLEQLQLEYNKQRQYSITAELLDIVGGQVRD